MKKVFAIMVAISVVFSSLGGIAVFAENQYISNGTFAQGSKTGWSTNWADGSNGTIAAEQISGTNYALHMQSEGSGYVMQKVSGFEEGDRLTLSFDLRTVALKSNGKATITIGYKDSSSGTDVNIGEFSTSYYDISGKEWMHKEIELLVPKGADKLHVLLRLLDGGDIYYDNVEITDGKNKTSLVVTSGDLVLDRIPTGIGPLTAKLHYVPQSKNETGNIIFAMYESEGNKETKLTDLKIQPFTASKQIYAEASLTPLSDTSKISVKAYAWKNGQTLEPIVIYEILPKEGRNAVYDRFVIDRMRGAYGGMDSFYDESTMQNLLDAGINTFIFNIIGTYHGGSINKNTEALNRVCDDVDAFIDKTGAAVFMKASFGSNSVINNNTYGLYSPGVATSATLPCPLSREYWEKEMLSRLEVVAKHPKITGVVFDMEMYGSGTSTTRYSTACYCDTCVAKFNDAGICDKAAELSAASIETRRAFARTNGFYETYEKWFENEVTALTTIMREKLHAINPSLIIGYMPQLEWLPGISKGLGTKEMPVVVFSEVEYKGSTRPAYMRVAHMLRDELPAVYAVGLWSSSSSAIAPANIAAKIESAGIINMGYWIYAISSINKEPAFYDEIKKGNDRLDTKLGLD